MFKKTVLFVVLTILVIHPVLATRICFQDNTFMNSIRVCNTTGSCVIIGDGNCSNINNIRYIGEVGGDKISSIDVYNVGMGNIEIGIIIIICLTIISVIIVLMKKQSKK